MPKKEPRQQRVNRLAKRLATRYERLREKSGKRKKPMKRVDVNSRRRVTIAYDLETTRIEAGTPKPLYFTAYGKDISISLPVLNGSESLAQILIQNILIEENNRARLIAWNGNNFDIYFIVRALLNHPEYEIRPYLTRSKSLRGCKIILKAQRKNYWEFLDGIAMTGLTGRKLEFFLKTFAPDFQKLDAPNWDSETFDITNKKHVEYAERDSEGLFHAIDKAQAITLEHIGLQLQPTIGNLGIKAFIRHMPYQVQVWQPPLQVIEAIRKQAMRGGYCHCVERYHGKIWKYDLNQAYAAAMRDARLPCGSVVHYTRHADSNMAGIVRLSAERNQNTIPFYYRKTDGTAHFGTTVIEDTWITNIELKQLERENWNITILESYQWTDTFDMKEYVYKLETVRINAPDGVNGATGLMMKAIGNNSYGKTVETLDGLELIMAAECPEGYSEYMSESEELQYVWFRFTEPMLREYHQPQVGAMITAHVRMQVRQAALLNPGAWLYADTDCVIFSEPVDLNPHPKLYGRWKEETAGEVFYIIEKKVYADSTAGVKHAKGMNVNRLTLKDFQAWYAGSPPKQTQVHKNNFVKFVTGSEMFHEHTKVGQRAKSVIESNFGI